MKFVLPLSLPLALLAISALSASLAWSQDSILSSIKAIRDQRDHTIWKQERLAQEYESAFIALWDELRASGNSFQVLRDFAFTSIDAPAFAERETLPESIEKWTHVADGNLWDRSQFLDALARSENLGFVIEQTEWHHAYFEATTDAPNRSEVTFSIHAKGPAPDLQRYIVKGILDVQWSSEKSTQGYYLPSDIGFKGLELITRTVPPTFGETVWLESRKRTTPYSIVLVEDLNQDSFPDIIFPKDNSIYFNQGDFTFKKELLAQFPIKGQTTAAALIDLNLDGLVEYVVASYDAPFLFAYSWNPNTGAFDGKPFGIWKSDDPLVIQLIAAADITGDGFPELYLGPSTPAYEGGNMPTPYFDANDGKPAYLLANNGGLRYTDITEQTDLASKRGRRAYVASFLDLDEDRRMDLVVTSDFSGVDVYKNSGNSLVDQTDHWVDNRSLFGMSQAFADFNRDGSLDLFAVGMSSTTARRLERMGLGREEFPAHQAMRMNIAYGNRLYFGDSMGKLKSRTASVDVARSGWSWGSSSLDFNNDSYPDIYVANGYLSKETARDYCTNFWTHDIYEEPNASLSELSEFFDKLGPKALVGGNQMGWNPFEKSHLYLNLGGEGFLNVAYLFNVAHGGDGRAVIGEDFDRDGRVDLLVVEQDSLKVNESVFLYSNGYPQENNWIGIDLKRSAGKPLLGTRVRLFTSTYETDRAYTIGDAYSAQNSSTMHFGIGDENTLKRIEILWPNGENTIVENPPVNQYHRFAP